MNFSSPWASNNAPTLSSPFPPFASVSYKPSASSTFTSAGTSLEQSFARDFKLGMTQSWNLSAEQQIGSSMVFRLAYVGSESYHQSVAVDQNAAIQTTGACTTSSPNYNQEAKGCYSRPYSAFNQILQDKSNGTSSYNSMQASFERHMSRGFQVQSSFTWAKSIDTASSSNVSFGNPLLGNPFNMNWNRGNSAMSMPWNWVSNFIYQAPSLKSKGRLMQETVGGWELSSIITYQTGNPFSVFASGLDWGQNDSGSMQYLDRADVVGGQSFNVGKGSHRDWATKGYFNTAAFANNASATFGDSAKNLIYGPREFGVDSAIMKSWSLAEGTKLQFRWEAFNATNHPSFGNPTGDYGNTVGWGNYGLIGNVGNIPPRVMQGALKLTF